MGIVGKWREDPISARRFWQFFSDGTAQCFVIDFDNKRIEQVLGNYSISGSKGILRGKLNINGVWLAMPRPLSFVIKGDIIYLPMGDGGPPEVLRRIKGESNVKGVVKQCPYYQTRKCSGVDKRLLSIYTNKDLEIHFDNEKRLFEGAICKGTKWKDCAKYGGSLAKYEKR